MNEDDIRAFDESATALVRTLPGFLWSFYTALCEEGFTESQALLLTAEYLKTTKSS